MPFLLAVAIAALAGCGGAGAGAAGTSAASGVASTTTTPTTPTQTITGTVATGKPLVATIIIKDSAGKTATGASAVNGAFSISVTGMKPPLMLATNATGQQNMYSILPTMDMTTTNTQNVNITPVTTLVMYELNGGTDPASMFNSVSFSKVTAVNVSTAVATVRSKLPLNIVPNTVNPNIVNQIQIFDMMYGNFVASAHPAGQNPDPYDAVLDNLGQIISIGTNVSFDKGSPYAPTSSSNIIGVGSITVAPAIPSIPAYGGGTTNLNATVLDTTKTPVPGATVTFTTSAGKLSAADKNGVATAITNANGVAAVVLTSGDNVLTATVTASSGGYTNTAQVVFTARASAAAAISLNAAPNTAFPGGSSTIIAAVVDNNGNPVAGETLTFSFDYTAAQHGKGSGMPALSATTATTDVNGLARVTYTAGAAPNGGTDIVTAITSYGIQPASGSRATITVASNAVIVGSVLAATSRPSILAGSGAAQISATVKDIAGAPLAGQTVTFTTSSGFLSAATATTNANGIATTTLSAGSVVLTATVSATTGGYTSNVNVAFTAGAAGSIALNAAPASIGVAGGTSTISALVTDASGNPIANEPVTFAFTQRGTGAPSLSVTTQSTNTNGLAIVTYTAGATAGTDTIKATTSNAFVSSVSVTSSGPVVESAASLSITTNQISVKSDNSTSATLTVTALNSANAAVPNIPVTMSADTGILGSATITTGPTGTATVTFSAGSNKINRTATITATAGAASAQLPVQIVGSSVTVNPPNATLSNNGTGTLTITAKDASGNIVPNAEVTLAKTDGTGAVTITQINNPALTPPSFVAGKTDSSGQYVATITGQTAGSMTVTAAALGATATTALTVSSSPAATFGIDLLTLNGTPQWQKDNYGNNATPQAIANPVAMKIGDSLIVEVNAPNYSNGTPIANVTFATTLGVWNGGTASAVTVPVVAGKATATLTTAQAGIANIQVYDRANQATSATLTVAMTSATASSITLQPSPGVVPKSVGTTMGSSTLIATVKDASGFPVGNAPVSFSIVNPTGGGESVSPVVVFSAATTAGGLNLGEARTSFTSGSLPSGATGVRIRASVVGTAVATNTAPSGNDATIVIGGTAGSVAFGQATVLEEDASKANYVLPMSVLVSDSNGNPAPPGTVVSLSVWPIAWSTGSGCVANANTATTGTFKNEDANENLILDANEDGIRAYYNPASGVAAGTQDARLTPPNSAAGSLPATVVTDSAIAAVAPAASGVAATTTATGVASFNLTYAKSSAIWIVDRIRARTVVQGTEMVSEIQFRLFPLKKDVSPDCLLPDSPYKF